MAGNPNASHALQLKAADAATKMLMNRDYSKFALLLEIMARSIGDQQMVDRIKSIKKETFIPFENFCMVYLRSLGMPSYRSFRFRGSGHKISAEEMRRMAQEQFIEPLHLVYVDLMGRMSLNQSVMLTEYLDNITDVGGIKTSGPSKIVFGEV